MLVRVSGLLLLFDDLPCSGGVPGFQARAGMPVRPLGTIHEYRSLDDDLDLAFCIVHLWHGG